MEQSFHAVPALTLVTQVKEQIQHAITSGELLPNQRLVEGEIAQKLGVSRGPVREAARLLEQSGLLISLPRRGFFVRQFEAREIKDLYELREWIEAAAVEAAVARATPAQHEVLRVTHKNLMARARSGQQSELIEAIIEFHRSICMLSGNMRLLRLFDEIAIEVRQILSVLGVKVDKTGYPVEAQESLLEAIVGKDRKRAMSEIRGLVAQAGKEVMDNYHRRQASGSKGDGMRSPGGKSRVGNGLSREGDGKGRKE
ncbi:MAG: GntR family transcriptional regulator [Parvibaculaceae bacterium]